MLRVAAASLSLIVLLQVPALGQILTGPRDPAAADARPGRPITLQFGAGPTVPLAHLNAKSEFDDGYALPGMNLSFRSFIPFSERLDVMVDLTLPTFKFKTSQFTSDHLYPVEDAKYSGKMLSLGARWWAWPVAGGRSFLLVSGGMYQLNRERFEFGVLRELEGAFRPGAAIGGGIQFTMSDFELHSTVRYHRFTDTGHFGLGDISWVEFAFMFSMRISD